MDKNQLAFYPNHAAIFDLKSATKITL